MAHQYFVERNGTVRGPLTSSQIQSGLESKKLKATDNVATSEVGPWRPLSDFGKNANIQDNTPSSPLHLASPLASSVSVQVDTRGAGSTRAPIELVPGEEQVSSGPAQTQPGILRSVIETLTTDAQDPKVVARVQSRIQEFLMRDEELLYIAIQNKPIVKFAPDCIVLTNKRFIIYKPTVLGRVSFEDYIWRELRDAKITEGIMGATISVLTAGGKTLSIDYLPKPQARQIYRLAQEQEEKALEERRQRSLEESRAAAGGVVVQSAVGTPAATPVAEPDDPVATLQKLKTMLDADLITTDEYEKKKAEIVAQM